MATSTIKWDKEFMNPGPSINTLDDMDNLTTAGFYTQFDMNIPANSPTTDPYNAAILVLKARNGTGTVQIWFTCNGHAIYVRFNSGAGWGSWHTVAWGGVKPFFALCVNALLRMKGGAWYDEHHQKAEGFAPRDERLGTDSHDSDAVRNLSIPDNIRFTNDHLSDMGRRHSLYPRRVILSGGICQFCSDGRPWRSVGLLGDLLPVMAKGVA